IDLQGWKEKDRKCTLVFYSDFSFCKIGNWVRSIPPGGRWGAGGGGSRSPCMPSMGPQIHGWDPDIATGSPYGRRLEKPIRGLSGCGYVAPAHGRGWHPPSFDPFEAVAHDGEAGGVADSEAQCPVTGAGGPGGDDGGGWWGAEGLPGGRAGGEGA